MYCSIKMSISEYLLNIYHHVPASSKVFVLLENLSWPRKPDQKNCVTKHTTNMIIQIKFVAKNNHYSQLGNVLMVCSLITPLCSFSRRVSSEVQTSLVVLGRLQNCSPILIKKLHIETNHNLYFTF